MQNLVKIIIVFSISIFLWSCSSTPRFTSDDDPKPDSKTSSEYKNTKKIPSTTSAVEEKSNSEITEYHNVTVLETTEGIASFYGKDFHGNQTSNGEIYDMYGISAAHPTYPEGTIARVTNLENGKSLIIRINDRMPLHPNRIIDLSYGAAEKLDMIKEGLAKVKIEVLKWGDGEYKR